MTSLSNRLGAGTGMVSARAAIVAVLAAAVYGAAVPRMGLPLLGVPVLVGGAYALVGRPRVAMAVWLMVVGLVPHWASVTAFGTWPPASLIALPCLLGALSIGVGRLNRVDIFVVVFASLAVAGYVIGDTPRWAFSALVIQGLLPYTVARTLAPGISQDWLNQAISWGVLFLSVWSIAEFFLDWHPFVGFMLGSSEAFWSTIQFRGGMPRSEGAFGHSIAFSAAIAIGAPFVIACPWPLAARIVTLGVMAIGLVTSGSRGGLGAFLLGIVLTLVLYRGTQLKPLQRVAIVLGATVLAVGAVTSLSERLSASSDEATNSAEYRDRLYQNVLEDVRPIGLADQVRLLDSGGYVWRGTFRSIDSEIVNESLIFGWGAVLVALLAYTGLLWRALTNRGSPAVLALLAQIPLLASVALITQYYALIWFLFGLVAADQMVLDRRRSTPARGVAQPIGRA